MIFTLYGWTGRNYLCTAAFPWINVMVSGATLWGSTRTCTVRTSTPVVLLPWSSLPHVCTAKGVNHRVCVTLEHVCLIAAKAPLPWLVNLKSYQQEWPWRMRELYVNTFDDVITTCFPDCVCILTETNCLHCKTNEMIPLRTLAAFTVLIRHIIFLRGLGNHRKCCLMTALSRIFLIISDKP